MGNQILMKEIGRSCDIYGRAGEVHLGFWWEDLHERDHLEDNNLEDNIKRVFKKCVWRSWTGLLWLRIGKRWQVLVSTVMNL